MTVLSQALSELRAARRETIRALAGLDPAVLTRPAPWRGATADVRFLLLRLADDDVMRSIHLEPTLAAAGHAPTQARRILGAARTIRGRLMGSLIGLSEVQFEQGWGVDEWGARQVLGHVIATDRRYLISVQYAVERARTGGTGPLRPPAASLPDGGGLTESQGSMDEVLARMRATRDELIGALAGLSDAELEARTNWVSWDLDVRFRLHRFAEHDREHLVQLRKTYAAVGFEPTEPQRILEEAEATRGAIEALLVGVTDETPAGEAAAAIVREAADREREEVHTILAAIGD